MSAGSLAERAAELRRLFDESFAAPSAERAAPTEDYLAVRAASLAVALRLAHVARVVAAPKIVSVPSARRSVLGVVAVRGVLVGVHDLAALLGAIQPSDRAAPRWIALAAGSEPIGLAFDDLDGFVRAPRETAGVLEVDGVARSIVDVPALVAAITTRQGKPARSND